MSDRALLEAAAKAAGYTINAAHQAARDAVGGGRGGLWIDDVSTGWNPLADDGDALRLAVKLKLNLEFFSQGVHVMALGAQPYSDDPYAATRRAIVRAAASIGSGKESAS